LVLDTVQHVAGVRGDERRRVLPVILAVRAFIFYRVVKAGKKD
jgi:hypothetical protein